MTQRKERWIIHGAATAAAGVGAGLTGIPHADTVALVQIQSTMVLALARLHGADPTYGEAMQVALAAAASAVGRGVTRVDTRWPGLPGRLLRASTAAAVTEAVGWAAVRAFHTQGEADADLVMP